MHRPQEHDNGEPGDPATHSPLGAMGPARPITIEELGAVLRRQAPEAFLVEPRVLRRVVRYDRNVRLLDWHGTHREAYALPGARAEGFLSRDEIGLPAHAPWPDMLILLVPPEDEELADTARGSILLKYSRLLTRARVLAAIARRRFTGALPRGTLLARVDAIGQALFDEIRVVLRQDHVVREPSDLATVYAEFAARYAELRAYAPGRVKDEFPSLHDPGRIDAVLEQDVDWRRIAGSSRLPGADPSPTEDDAQHEEEPLPEPEVDLEGTITGELIREQKGRARSLLRSAERHAARGNQVRAAIRKYQAALISPPERAETARSSGRRDLSRLCARLRPALRLTAGQADTWTRALTPLLRQACAGRWSPAARLLFDLQKAAVDQDHEVYDFRVFQWLLSLGRKPWRQPLPFHRDIRLVRHLATARRRLPRVRLFEHERDLLGGLLDDAIASAQDRLRSGLGEVLERTFAASDWNPANLPESVALQKLQAELLDRVVDRGYLSMGDLRDAVARNQLKLADLSGPAELVRGDQLLRTDDALAAALPGVYRRGEIYLRELQRFNAIGFGTRWGRAFNRYVMLPFGGAYVALKGTEHLVNEFQHLTHRPHVHLFDPFVWLLLGVFLLGLIVSPRFRVFMRHVARGVITALRWVFLRLPAWFLRQPLVLAIWRSRLGHWAIRWLVKPAVFALPAYALLRLLGRPRFDSAVASGAAFIASAILLNSRTGRDVEEIVADRTVRVGNRLLFDLIPGLFRLVMDTFDWVLEALERLLYTVDEWLRFRSGQGQWKVGLALLVAPVWSIVTYVVRFGVNLVIEPQINPIKHFPIVTVAHKVLVPVIFAMYQWTKGPPLYLDPEIAKVVAFALQFIVPGICGFLVWELKENWRLYRANRPIELRPAVVGAHGETVARLLIPGVHAGTIPKLYRKLRHADSRTSVVAAARRSSRRRYRDELDHVASELRRFVDREFLATLDRSLAWRGGKLAIGPVLVGVNCIEFVIHDQADASRVLQVRIEEQSGWLVAGIARGALLASLDPIQTAALRDALAGLYKLAGVGLVYEHIDHLLASQPRPYDVVEEGLVVWPPPGFDAGRIVPLGAPSRGNRANGTPLGTATDTDAETETEDEQESPLDRRQVLAALDPILWDEWVRIWDLDLQGLGHPEPALPGVALLPRPEPRPDPTPRAVGRP